MFSMQQGSRPDSHQTVLQSFVANICSMKEKFMIFFFAHNNGSILRVLLNAEMIRSTVITMLRTMLSVNQSQLVAGIMFNTVSKHQIFFFKFANGRGLIC